MGWNALTARVPIWGIALAGLLIGLFTGSIVWGLMKLAFAIFGQSRLIDSRMWLISVVVVGASSFYFLWMEEREARIA